MGKGMKMSAPSSSGGIMGSGIFGMFGTVVQCKSDDTSMYCSLAKIINVIMMLFVIIFFIYIIYLAFNYFTSKKTSGGLGPAPSMSGGYIPKRSMRSQSKK